MSGLVGYLTILLVVLLKLNKHFKTKNTHKVIDDKFMGDDIKYSGNPSNSNSIWDNGIDYPTNMWNDELTDIMYSSIEGNIHNTNNFNE